MFERYLHGSDVSGVEGHAVDVRAHGSDSDGGLHAAAHLRPPCLQLQMSHALCRRRGAPWGGTEARRQYAMLPSGHHALPNWCAICRCSHLACGMIKLVNIHDASPFRSHHKGCLQPTQTNVPARVYAVLMHVVGNLRLSK